MKLKLLSLNSLFNNWLYFSFSVLMMLVCTATFAGEKPNVLLILTDDQGWGDVGFNDNELIDTPNIDAIGEQGVSFERFYVSPVCSPTRASLLTGRHSLKTGVFGVTRGKERMKSEEVTIAEVLKQQGYATGMFGKWHNGAQYPHDPIGQGFDEYLGLLEGHQTLYFDPVLLRNGKPVKTSGYIADVTTNAAIDFIKANQRTPFFAYVPYNTPHGPYEVPESYFEKYKKRGLDDLDASVYGMMENMDDNIGRLLDTLEELELRENTIVIFLSDNGPSFPAKNSRYNGGMKGRKGKLDEGGVRVPFFIHWPRHIEGGEVVKAIAQHIDLLPSLSSLLGVPLPEGQDIDGMDLSALMTEPEKDKSWPDRKIYIHNFRITSRDEQPSIKANPGSVRTQRWLAIFERNETWTLYDLVKDPLQKQNVAKQFPKQLQELKQDYLNWYEEVSANTGDILPVEIGHAEATEVVMGVHEGLVSGEGIKYAHGAGWAHDWVEINPSKKVGVIRWPIKVVEAGNYKVVLEYQARSGDVYSVVNINSKSAPNKGLRVKVLPAFKGQEIAHQRRIETVEAPEYTWANLSTGTIALSNGEQTIELQVNGSKANHKWLLKTIKLIRAD